MYSLMKLGIFTDSHYSSQEVTCGNRFNSKSLDKIKEAYAFFEKEDCEMVICLGDLIDKEDSHDKEVENLKKVSAIITTSPLPTRVVMGNHDGFAFEKDEFYGILGIEEPKDIYVEGKNLLFLDGCYFKSGQHYAPGDKNWKDTFLPHQEALKEKLSGLKDDTYIFIHQNIDPAIRSDHRLFNADKVFEIIQGSKTVKAVFQGHYHKGTTSQYDGIKYITPKAMCENEKAYLCFDL